MSRCIGAGSARWKAARKTLARIGIVVAAVLLWQPVGRTHEDPPKQKPPRQRPVVQQASLQQSSPEQARHVHPPGNQTPHEHPAQATPAPPTHPAEQTAPHEHAADAQVPSGLSHEDMTAGHIQAQGEPQHEAAASVPDSSFVQTLMLLTLLMGGVLLVLARLGLRPAEESRAKAEGRDLLALPGLGRLLRWRHFSTLLIAPTLAIFTLIVLAGLWGEQNSSNPAVLLTWILWWPAVIFTFFLVGRIWCTACPFGYLGDVAQKIFSFKRKAPAILKNMWWRLALFLGLTWATTLWAWDRWPRSTAWLALALTLGAIALAIIYEKRVFCRYVCPVGGVFGLYSMTAPLRLAVKDKQICQTECKEKNCYKACAWFQFPGAMERNAECNLCLNCVPACPYDNLALRTQPFGADLARFQPHRKSLDEAATVAAVLGVSLLQTMVMLNAWQGWEPRLAAFLHIPSGPVLYTLIFLSLGLVMPVLLVALLLRMGSLGLPHRAGAFAALRTYAYAFLPLGLGLHAAHNFHHLFGEGGALWTGLKAALARYTGWDSLAPGSSIDAGAAVAPNALFFLQWLALLGGLYLAFRIATSLVQRHSAEKAMAFRMALPIFLFAVGYTILNVLILAAPMAHRH